MTEDQKRAYVLADNKLAPNAGWDDDLLAVELGILMSSDLDFDVGITGFSIPEINSLIETVEPEEPCDPADDVVQENDPARVPLGNVWQLGPHRLVCGDALEAETVNTLMDGSSAQMITTDPSYNVPIDGHVDNSGKNPHREFVMASGEMTSSEFTQFLTTSLANMAEQSVDGSIHFVCMDWRHMTELLTAGNTVHDELKNLIVWTKDNGRMGTSYRSRHELIFAFKKGQELAR